MPAGIRLEGVIKEMNLSNEPASATGGQNMSHELTDHGERRGTWPRKLDGEKNGTGAARSNGAIAGAESSKRGRRNSGLAMSRRKEKL